MALEAPDNFDASSVATLSVEFWRLVQASQAVTEHLPKERQARFQGQLRFSERQLDTLLDQLGLKLVSFEGEDFHPGISASAENADDFDGDAELVVERTLEPTVVAGMTVIRPGRILVTSKAKDK